MKKLIITSAAALMSLTLAGCGTMDSTTQFTNQTVGTGVQYGVKTVGTGVGYVAQTGSFVGRGVGTVVGTGVGFVTGQPGTYQTVKTKNGMIYQNGHYYKLHHGKYVLVR